MFRKTFKVMATKTKIGINGQKLIEVRSNKKTRQGQGRNSRPSHGRKMRRGQGKR